MARWNILYIVQSGKLGGAEISMLLLLKHLNREQFNSIVLAPIKSDVYLKVKELNVEVINVTLPGIKSYNPFRMVKSLYLLYINSRKIRKIIKNHNISIVHTISNKRSAAFGILAARLAKVPVIWTIRNFDWLGIIDRLMIVYADKLITVSEAINNLFNKKPSQKNKFVKIYNAVDISNFHLELNKKRPLLNRWDFKKADVVVAMVGRLSPEKNHQYFIEAASKLLKQESNLKFIIIGEKKFYGDENYYHSLINQCHRMRVENEIKFINFENDIPAIMATIDLLVLVSEHEPFGRVLIEAMAMEKPVIASDIGGPKEIVAHNKTGLLIEPKNAAKLADAILYIYRNPKIARKMGREGRKRVMKYFLVDRYIHEHERVYREIITRGANENLY